MAGEAGEGRARNLAAALLSLGAVGEMGVGLAVLVYPPLLGFLLQSPLGTGGLLTSRMAGIAVLALGITWWTARNEANGLSKSTPAFLVYNLAVGVLFLVQALALPTAALFPWVVALLHLSAGIAFGAAVLVGGSRR